MSDLAHERARLHALVDKWITDREHEDGDNARIDQAAIVGLVAATDEDGDEVEGVFSRWETGRRHIQLGIAHALVLEAQRPYHEA
jgi:hypothetical protein